MFKKTVAPTIKQLYYGKSFDSNSSSSSADMEVTTAEQLDTANELYFAEK